MTQHAHDPDRVEIIHFPEDTLPKGWHQPVLALGNFDGVHRGHAKIIDRVRRRADERGVTAAVLTFDPHPSRVVRPDKAPPLLMTSRQKLDVLAGAGMAGVASAPSLPKAPAAASRTPESSSARAAINWGIAGAASGPQPPNASRTASRTCPS